MSNNDTYNPLHYETLIRRAYKLYRTSGQGAYSFFMESLMAYENMPTLVEMYQMQLEKVKDYLEKAFNKFLKLDLEEYERQGLIRLKEDLHTAYTSAKISGIVSDGLAITDRFRPA